MVQLVGHHSLFNLRATLIPKAAKKQMQFKYIHISDDPTRCKKVFVNGLLIFICNEDKGRLLVFKRRGKGPL